MNCIAAPAVVSESLFSVPDPDFAGDCPRQGPLPLSLELSYADGRKVLVGLQGGVSATGEFLAALDEVVAREHYRLDAKPDIFAEPPERKPWERK